MSPINIQFTRFSAFYSPLLATVTGGFLAAEGLEPRVSTAPPGTSAINALVDGSAHVAQSALSQGLVTADAGHRPAVLHFAQVNEMDGFFLAGRQQEPGFRWGHLAGKRVLVDHARQPLAMFRYACHAAGVAFGEIDVVDAGNPGDMESAFRSGTGDYIHLQGPAPQQLEHEGAGYLVASVGKAVGRCGFSSLAATPEWLEGDMALAFMRAYRRARDYVNDTPPGEIARAEAEYFEGIHPEVLTRTIASYQELGCWSRHPEITPAAYAATIDIFVHAGFISTRPDYDTVCALPPDSHGSRHRE